MFSVDFLHCQNSLWQKSLIFRFYFFFEVTKVAIKKDKKFLKHLSDNAKGRGEQAWFQAASATATDNDGTADMIW
jgi:hypothetical protein